MGSSRLPAKILLDLGGKTALERCLTRVSRISDVAEVVLATTDLPMDDVTENVARRLGYRVFRGSETDVLSRYVGALREAKADILVRCTSDCPLLDPEVSSLVVRKLVASQSSPSPLDYVSNTLTRRLPRGLDTEAVTAPALERAARESVDVREREHVTMPVYRNPDRYKCDTALPEGLPDLQQHRWTLDTLDDYRFLFHLYEALGSRAEDAGWQETLAVVEENPWLLALNAHVEQAKT